MSHHFTCNWPQCAKPIKFELKPTVLRTHSGDINFKLSEIGKNLNESLTDIIPRLTVETPAPPVFNYCDGHWMEKAKAWARDEKTANNPVTPETYKAPRAKTTAEGIFIQNNNVAFLHNTECPPKPNGDPNVIPIVSCFVHEIIHYWSYKHKGLQGKKGVADWDEAICDWIAFPVYSRTMGGIPIPGGGKISTYCTPYGKYLEWLNTGAGNWQRLVNGFRGKQFVADPSKRAKLPSTVKAYFASVTDKTSGQKYGDLTVELWKKALRLMMTKWFFDGKDGSFEGYKNYDDFLNNQDDVFVGQVGKCFNFGDIKETSYKI